MFQVKTFISILASMVNRFKATSIKSSDFNEGSVVRTMMEASAQEIDELYQQMMNGIREAIPVATYTSFNFPALKAQAAANLIRVFVNVQSKPVTILAGTLMTRSDGTLSYTVTTDVIIPAGASFGDVPVVATVTGTAGNMAANGLFSIASPPAGFVSATNLSPITNGSPAESVAAQKLRFNAYIQTLSRATVPSLLYALTRLSFITDAVGNQIERVASANIDEPYKTDPTQPPGLVNSYIHNGVGTTSPALVARALAVVKGYTDSSGAIVPGYVAAGVEVTCTAASEVPLDVIGMLTIAPTYDKPSVVAQVTAALFTYIQQIPVGDPYLSAIANDLVVQVPGVWNWMPISPPAYVASPFSAKLMPGKFQIVGWLQTATQVRTTTSGALT